MSTDELHRAVRALVACKGWSQNEALLHLLRMPQERRARISESLKAWAIEPLEGESAPLSLDESLATHLRAASPHSAVAPAVLWLRDSASAEDVSEPVA